MIRIATLTVVLAFPSIASACGGSPGTVTAAKASDTEQVASSDPSSCAKNAKLVGANCSYSTGMMAQRVLAEGSSWTYAGTLTTSSAVLESHVAAPYTVGPDKISVIANEILEDVMQAGLEAQRVSLEGKLLEVDGVRYFVLLTYAALNA